MPRVSTRRPLHAGSWYEAEPDVLSESIDAWMSDVEPEAGVHPRAIIGPHAGYRFCGHVMAHAYRHIDPSAVTRIFLLGPSHHIYSRRCLLSPASSYSTPLGNLEIDADVYAALKSTQQFDVMDIGVDEAEHSLELHSPYIAYAMRGRPFKLVPIMVGALSNEAEAKYGQLLAPYLDDPGTLFIISSDFCHWGSRFSYTLHERSKGAIWQSIECLDRQGMSIIEQQDPAAFASYLEQYHNTICGRHPIGVLLNMLQHCATRFDLQFRCYDQSSKCLSPADSSVSYAAATLTAQQG